MSIPAYDVVVGAALLEFFGRDGIIGSISIYTSNFRFELIVKRTAVS